MGRRLVRLVCCAPAAALLSGCYEYAAARGAAPPLAGREVRVELTDAGTAALAPSVGPGVTSLVGRLVASDDSALTVAVESTVKRNGLEDLWKGENVSVQRAQVAVLQERAFSKSKTAVASGLAVALGVAFYAALGGSLGGGSGGPGNGGPPK